MEFCRQEGLDPLSDRFNVISGLHDVHKLYGYTEFDVVFLTHWERVKGIGQIRQEIVLRTSGPWYKGTFYYLET